MKKWIWDAGDHILLLTAANKVEKIKKDKEYIENQEDINIDTGDTEAEFFYILYEKVGEDLELYSPKKISGWNEIEELLSHLKSPPHWIGRRLSRYKFKDTRRRTGKKYWLSKETILDIINRYYPTKEITQTTLNTQTT